MSKLLLFIAVLLLVFSGLPLLAAEGEELEVGLSMVPIGAITQTESEQYGEGNDPDMPYEEKNFMDEWLVGFHVAYNWGIIYASLDSFALPAFMMKDMTKFEDEHGFFDGHDRPGFINFFDAGLKITMGDIVVFATTGVNTLYVYRQAELPEEQTPGSFGTNLRMGASYKFANNVSIGITGTAIFPDFQTMGDSLKGVFGDPEYAQLANTIQVLPMIMAVVYM